MNWRDPGFYAGVAVYGLAVFNCFKVLGNRSSAGASIAWILLHLTMPYVAVPIYFLVGDFRIRGYVKRHLAAKKTIENSSLHVDPLAPKDSSQLAPAIRQQVKTFRKIFRPFGAIFEPQQGSVELLVDGSMTFAAIFAAISGAKHYIVVQYYIVRSDRMGLELKRLLSERAREGIAVYMLTDDMGSFWLSRKYLRDLRKDGVKVERFLPIASFKRFFQVNFRNHRKLVAVDGLVAFTGGLNVGEEYAARRSKKAKRRYWRDTHIKVTGGSVAQLEDGFFEDWYFATGQKVELTPPPATASPSGPTTIQIIPTGPTDPTVLSMLFVLQMINCAKERLWIATPYLVPDPAILHALELAALRGVDVRLMIPKIGDNHLVQWVSVSYARELRGRGVKVAQYTRGFMHQKVILVDRALAAVGTMNLDNRALYLNFETMVLVHEEDFNSQVAAMLEIDFSTCRELRQKSGKLRRHLENLRGNAASLLAPML